MINENFLMILLYNRNLLLFLVLVNFFHFLNQFLFHLYLTIFEPKNVSIEYNKYLLEFNNPNERLKGGYFYLN